VIDLGKLDPNYRMLRDAPDIRDMRCDMPRRSERTGDLLEIGCLLMIRHVSRTVEWQLGVGYACDHDNR
jgi:hypothetical protein